MVAAFGDLQIAVVARGQLQPRLVEGGLGDQVDVRALGWRRGLVDCLDHVFVLVGAGHRQDGGVRSADCLGILAHAAGHDHAAVLGDGFADCGQAFFLRTVEEAAGIDQDDIGAGVVRAHRIAVGAQAGEDALAVDERLGTAEADHPDLLLIGDRGRGSGGHCAAPLHPCAPMR